MCGSMYRAVKMVTVMSCLASLADSNTAEVTCETEIILKGTTSTCARNELSWIWICSSSAGELPASSIPPSITFNCYPFTYLLTEFHLVELDSEYEFRLPICNRGDVSCTRFRHLLSQPAHSSIMSLDELICLW
ncbi:hypothetical protein Mp_5g07290 [Marchantia polymorpha subsp. ruderalis]|uniref:Uncharacterized protein n=2 Tax=Marchantia polymorpha TaxID=3197 RepID=A0AAF6BFV5_MARPO|nr:hypothetical protein MARPO_3941s0001 [Marchantia polymorpha]BBN10889.1 hypothetical protein Mp_5g07290 [Marchantia polymorpha subsp. ruderalis]|eukprot:PTQ26253.1 hypothetical protein MARPO_3941s0001 [Marchantia polymorpha]